ncbi:hypothetical protein [Microbacterium enclense]|uniref:hypothetical protein n=1 Tax=Microbacterium enclense TaxID=993073 RepID=UPI003F7EFCCB
MAQVVAVPTVTSFIESFVAIDSVNTDLSAWRASLRPFTRAEVPVTAVARVSSGLANLRVHSQMQTASSTDLTVTPSSTGAVGGVWKFTATGTVVATYTTSSATTVWSMPGTWVISLDPDTRLVVNVTETIPMLGVG